MSECDYEQAVEAAVATAIKYTRYPINFVSNEKSKQDSISRSKGRQSSQTL
jgi:hypothetical protein